ncbi:MAG: DUF2892 domain-containing protein [Meiothermus sp.]|uniref:YgaP family membrane protein n=1 Tax=Meiothermus sp. TaxID=1955249 RepID=UPI0025CFBB42|nr:DUF2892 domain-containing protein [Meiothermus sp.]MCS7058955.1 DUF2892 domain-containing protein [Meiothermus sp.]MCS7195615.1 DUF2892 domain-containing protein [Meiothermus sp.]MCX7741231.1 DUF2892 domain-containing protein [Meiothermus sp.]MDW8091489.1 DUF2892 domain-containing protein [Meiothermus sp.]MDW8480310.1 DUF2892 domain-containing protein [Meiothermus sp.]
MVPNIGSTERLVRYILAVVFLLIAFFGSSGGWAWVFGILGVVLLVTASLNFCPLWALLKINTRGKAT